MLSIIALSTVLTTTVAGVDEGGNPDNARGKSKD